MIRLIRASSRTRRMGSRLEAVPAVILVAAVTASLLGAVPAVRAQTASGIVAGESIGPARLGMTESQLADLLGPSTAEGPTRRLYPHYGVIVDFQGGVATRISTFSSKYRTFAGAGVGSGPDDTARLIGDLNSVRTVSGQGTTILYEFQGIGFVFRGGHAVETFIVEAMPFGEKQMAGAPGNNPEAPPSATQSPSSAAQPAGPGAIFRDLKITVLPGGGLTLTGTVVNTGTLQPGPLTVTGLFTYVSGAQVESKAEIQGPLPPGASASFSLSAATASDIVLRYQVSVVNASGAMLAATPVEAVPPAAYADFARGQMHIKVEVGAPSGGVGPPSVQALVSVADTGAIPPQWVRQVSVQVRYNTASGTPGVQNTDVRPGQTQTVPVPAGATIGVPLITGVVLGGG
jgi:hypothetical protein